MFQGHHRVITLVLATALVLGFGRVAPANAVEGVDVDESQIDALSLSVLQDPATYAGISLDPDGGLTVRYAQHAGPIAAKTKLAGHTSVKADGGKRSKVRFVQVKRSMRELDAIRERVQSDSLLNKVLSRHVVDVPRNIVSVGLTKITPEIERAVKAEFGDVVELHVAAREKRVSRVDDNEPWIAGIRINTFNGNGCTVGYVIRSVSVVTTTRRLVTAGHCATVGTNWYNQLAWVGTTVVSRLDERGWDYAYIGNSTYYPATYIGGPTSSTTRAITGPDTSIIGKKYCTNGATSGEVCWGTVTGVNACIRFDDGITTCNLDVMNADYGQVMVRPGDSGGALINYPGGKLKVGGIIVGGSTQVYFHAAHRLHPASPYASWVMDSLP